MNPAIGELKKPVVSPNNMGLVRSRVDRKMGNELCEGEYDGKGIVRFKSKLERRVADYLELLRKAGHIATWSYEETTFRFPDIGNAGGETRWKVDFDVMEKDGLLYYIEAKGRKLGSDLRKLRLLREYRPDVRMMYVCQTRKLAKTMQSRWKNVLWRIVTIGELTHGKF